MQTYTVPAGVTSVLVKAWGAGGGGSTVNPPLTPLTNYGGGVGGFTSAYVTVTPGQVLQVLVGGGGASAALGSNSAGGFGGGGVGVVSDGSWNVGGGGGIYIGVYKHSRCFVC